MLKRILLAAVVMSFCSTIAFAQNDGVFLAFGQGANSSTTSTVSDTDTSGTVFLYSALGFDFESFDVDIFSSNTGVAEITGATIFNPFWVGFGPNINRFTNPFADDGFRVGDDIIVNGPVDANGRLGVVGVGSFGGFGVQGFASSFDTTFDADLDAFLIAEINFDIVGAGTAEIGLEATDISFLVSSSPAVFAQPVLGSATLVVGVPEPSALGLLAFGLVGFAARRRR